MKGSYILHLASWYPNKISPVEGHFVKDQISVINTSFKSVVVNVIEKLETGDTLEITEQNGISTYIYYIEKKKGLSRAYRYYTTFWKVIQQVIKERGMPSFVHTHVSYKASALAWFLKRQYGLTYIISEHFTALTKESNHKNKRFIIGYSRFFANQGEVVLPISHYLQKSLVKNGFKRTKVIHNMIDDSVFNRSDRPTASKEITRFLHISNLRDSQKNYKSIFEAFSEAAKINPRISLSIISHDAANLEEAKSIVSSKYETLNILFKREMSPGELADEMKAHDCLLMYSNYETFSMVIAEALATGLRVIASDIGGPREIITSEKLGTLIGLNNIKSLTRAIVDCSQREDANSKERSDIIISKFGKSRFLDEISDVYNQMLESIA